MALTQDDHTQIHALYARYAFASDFGPSEAWRDCFTPDALFEVNGKQHRGADALLKFAQGMHSRPVRSNRHWNNNLVIEESRSGATGKAYFTLLNVAESPRQITMSGVYNDELAKTPQGWKFSSRKIIFDQV
jgi:3-phenylpropionate/cinnamic acid dioxygenase small subunit